MQSFVESDQTIIRLLNAYRLYTFRHAFFYRHPIYFSAKAAEKHIRVFQKISTILADPQDPEGYIRAAFELFQTPYPNMLLSKRILVYYERYVDSWKRELMTNLLSQISRFQLYCTSGLPTNFNLSSFLFFGQDFDPVLYIYIKTKLLRLQASDNDRESAEQQFLSWPFGYMTNSYWHRIVQQIEREQLWQPAVSQLIKSFTSLLLPPKMNHSSSKLKT